MEYADFFDAFHRQYPDLARGLAGARGLGGVMAWMRGRGLALGDVWIFNQDEFELDFVIPLGDGRHLAFGIT
jgi:hypothetical protein